MAASSGSLHEDPEVLSAESKDRHRAIVSIMEEFEAIDWYDQRVQAASSSELAAILGHNRDEEKVRLYFEESVTFRSITPEAAVAIVPATVPATVPA